MLVNNEEPQQLLKYYFKVNQERSMEAAQNLTWLQKSKILSLDTCSKLVYSTFISYFIKLFTCCCKKKCKKRRRLSRLFDKSNDMLEKSLDVRTLMRMQSLMVTNLKVFYQPKHYSQLKLQKHARTLLKDEKCDQDVTSVIYGDDSDPGEEKALKVYIKAHQNMNSIEQLSPRTQSLNAGIFPSIKVPKKYLQHR